MYRTPASILTAIAAIAAGAALSACGGGSPAPAPKPTISAATACKDFRTWFLGANPNLSNVAKIGSLKQAVAAAPSGQLYQDLSTLESNVVTASQASGSLGQAEDNYLVSGAAAVQNDCESVNPDS